MFIWSVDSLRHYLATLPYPNVGQQLPFGTGIDYELVLQNFPRRPHLLHPAVPIYQIRSGSLAFAIGFFQIRSIQNRSSPSVHHHQAHPSHQAGLAQWPPPTATHRASIITNGRPHQGALVTQPAVSPSAADSPERPNFTDGTKYSRTLTQVRSYCTTKTCTPNVGYDMDHDSCTSRSSNGPANETLR